MAIPTTEPITATAGDTITWEKSFSNYPASDGWMLSYAFVNEDGQFLVDGSKVVADDDDFVVTIPSTDSKDYSPGDYQWQAYVTKSGERFQVGSGTSTVKPDFATQTTGYDARSIVKKTLDALEATLLKKASKDQMSMTVPNGRSIDRLSPTELLSWYDKLKAQYAAEVQAEKSARGIGGSKKILPRFSR